MKEGSGKALGSGALLRPAHIEAGALGALPTSGIAAPAAPIMALAFGVFCGVDVAPAVAGRCAAPRFVVAAEAAAEAANAASTDAETCTAPRRGETAETIEVRRRAEGESTATARVRGFAIGFEGAPLGTGHGPAAFAPLVRPV